MTPLHRLTNTALNFLLSTALPATIYLALTFYVFIYLPIKHWDDK